jgi:hypothetical protein
MDYQNLIENVVHMSAKTINYAEPHPGKACCIPHRAWYLFSPILVFLGTLLYNFHFGLVCGDA